MDSLSNYRIRRGFKEGVSKVLFSLYRLQAAHPVDAKKHNLFISECTYSPWTDDTDFKKLYMTVKDHTLVDVNKVYLIYSYISQLCKLGVRGDAFEVGVWRGGVGMLIAQAFKHFSGSEVNVYLADTYEGMPKTVKEDNFYKGGELADTSVKVVTDLAQSCKLKKVHILQGYFPDQTSHLVDSSALAFVHIDVDIYESAAKSFDWAWPKVADYGMVVFDDYGYSSTEGVTDFVNSFIKNKPDAMFMFNMGGQAVVIKMPKLAKI